MLDSRYSWSKLQTVESDRSFGNRRLSRKHRILTLVAGPIILSRAFSLSIIVARKGTKIAAMRLE